MKIQKDLSSFLYESVKFFAQYSFLNEYESRINDLARNSTRPFNVAVFGRMKTGKSTLINSLIGKPLAITGVEEATATINVISHSKDSDMLNNFKVHWKDSPAQLFPLEKLQEYFSGKDEDVLARVARTKYLQLYSNDDKLALHEIIDTPGTGSSADEHEKIAKDFIDASVTQGRNADALVYVFSPIGRESDLEALGSFKQGCLPSSKPYNSVAVLHKWDDLYWSENNFSDIENKAERLYEKVKDSVSKVIPLSAPLAIAANNAPDKFFDDILKLNYDEVANALRRDEKWDRDPTREALRKSHYMPWSSFQILVREICTKKPKDIKEARQVIFNLSGLGNLIEFLDKNFFKNGAIIRLRQTLAKLNFIRKNAHLEIDKYIQDLETDNQYWKKAIENLPSDLTSWAECKKNKNTNKIENIKEHYYQWDRMFINSEIPLIIKDIDLIPWAKSKLSEDEFSLVEDICSFFIENKKPLVSKDKLDSLKRKVLILKNSPFSEDKKNAKHLAERILEFNKIEL